MQSPVSIIGSIFAGVLLALVSAGAPGTGSNTGDRTSPEFRDSLSRLFVARSADTSEKSDTSLVPTSQAGNLRGWRSVSVRVRLCWPGSVAASAVATAQGLSCAEQTASGQWRRPPTLQSRQIRLQV